MDETSDAGNDQTRIGPVFVTLPQSSTIEHEMYILRPCTTES